jgi:transposase
MKKHYDSKFKSKVSLEAIKGELSISEIASKYEVHPNMVSLWKKKVLENLSLLFQTKSEKKSFNTDKFPEDELLKQIGQLKVENDFMRKKYEQWVGKLD